MLTDDTVHLEDTTKETLFYPRAITQPEIIQSKIH